MAMTASCVPQTLLLTLRNVMRPVGVQVAGEWVRPTNERKTRGVAIDRRFGGEWRITGPHRPQSTETAVLECRCRAHRAAIRMQEMDRRRAGQNWSNPYIPHGKS